MPLFMDVHTIDGGVATDVDHDVTYLRNRVAEAEGKILCLVQEGS